MSRRYHTHSPEETHALGVALGRVAFSGAIVLLHGDLGAGKTAFARGVGEGLGVPTRVQSPTYILLQAHPDGRIPLWHADLYRLVDEEDLEQLGLDDVVGAEGVVLVEWPERAPGFFPTDHLAVWVHIQADDTRILELQAHGPRHRALEVLVG